MKYYLAPLEGITGYIFRNAHQKYFTSADKYFTPFLVPKPNTGKQFTAKELADILPEHNQGIYLVPQIMTNKAEDFVTMANALQEYGYQEINLNLGCPSKTVVSKGRGSGFLSDTEKLNRFFDFVFSHTNLKISVKTRIGLHDPDEFPDFYFDLPQELIAQDPLEDRSSSRLLVLDRESGKTQHRVFRDIIEYLNPGDCLVVNNTKVIPARLYGSKIGTDAKIEVLLLKRREHNVWETLVKPGKKCRVGARISFGEGLLIGEVIDVVDEGNRLIRFEYEGIFEEILDKLGQMPLPPYIHHQLKDKNRYQTVYAKHDGSAAAPTAGLHFTPELLEEIKKKGVHIAHVTLHVGLGTFRPVKVEDVTDHHMHSEFYIVEPEQAELINRVKKEGGKIVAVGTTSCRTLESATDESGILKAGSGWTEIFIYPGYQFKMIDRLITNFHLPESTLMMLVSALAGKDKIMAAYEEAVKERYRFFSFGDAMFIM